MGLKNLLLAVLLVLAMVTPSLAASNNPPPAGAILDLAPGIIPHSTAQLYTVDFTGASGLTATAITFAFRDDRNFITFSNASVVDLTTSSGNLLLNGNFATGDLSHWTYANIYGATFSGSVAGSTGNYYWYDGSVQAYDAISQTIATTPGDTYQISFDVVEGSRLATFSDLSTNGDTTDTGGNGVDVLAYAQAGLPPAAVPEPVSLFLFGTGLVGVAVIGRRI